MQNKTNSNPLEPNELATLVSIFVHRFNEEELHALCFSLGIDYSDLLGNGKSSKARELAQYLKRHNLISKLLEIGVQLRPDIDWEIVSIQPSIASEKSKIYHNLPQRDYVEFIGREDELERLFDLLSSRNRSWIVTIDGVGGIGKSALALEVAHRYRQKFKELPSEDRFDAIVWTSAKQNVLTVDGITNRRQTLHTLDDIYTAIAITLGRENIIRTVAEQQNGIARQALTQQRTLLIIDNLETIDDENLLTFLRELPTPTKAIVTTRYRIDVAYPIRLVGMSWENAQIFITHECHKKNVHLNEQEARHLYERTGGVPLAIVWSIAQVSFGYNIQSVFERLGQPNNDISRFCFDEAIKRIRNSSSYQLFMALSLCATNATRETVGYITDLPKSDRDECLVQLEKLSLINKQGNRFSMLPLTRSYGLHELDTNPQLAETFAKRWAKKLTETFVMPSDRFWLIDQEIILREGSNFLSLFDWSRIREIYDVLFEVAQPSVLYFHHTGRRTEALKIALDVKELARNQNLRLLSAWLCIECGWILGQQGMYSQALDRIKEGGKDYEYVKNQNGICFAECFEAQVLRLAGKVTEAEQKLKNSIELAAQIAYHEGLVIGEFEFGKLERDRGNWLEAYSCFAKSFRLLTEYHKKLTDIFSLSVLGNYGAIALRLGRITEARDATIQVIGELERWRPQDFATDFTARMHLQAAQVEEKLGNVDEAIYHAQQGLTLARSTYQEGNIKLAEQMLMNLGNI
jgi:tetratricopeptide (TPR) repeat protein